MLSTVQEALRTRQDWANGEEEGKDPVMVRGRKNTPNLLPWHSTSPPLAAGSLRKRANNPEPGQVGFLLHFGQGTIAHPRSGKAGCLPPLLATWSWPLTPDGWDGWDLSGPAHLFQIPAHEGFSFPGPRRLMPTSERRASMP